MSMPDAVNPTFQRVHSLLEIQKKTDVVEHPEVFDHVGLLVNEPPGTAGLPFV